MIDLTISIVSWNVADLLKECLGSIYGNTSGITFEVYVSDNASSDGTAEMVKKNFPQVGLFANSANLGFPKGNNQVLKVAKGRYVMLLNPDTVVTPGTFETMIKFMDEHPEAGAAGPRLEYPEGGLQLSCRTFPTLETELYKAFYLDQLFPKSRIFGKYVMSYWDHNDVREVDQPMGAALLVRKDAMDKVGLMDENLFFWYDEVDWCKRIKNAGWKIFFIPSALICHHKNKSFGQWKRLRSALNGMKIWRASRSYYFKKHFGPASVPALYLFDVINLGIPLAAACLIVLGMVKTLGALLSLIK
jgi:GT2 family glycosyltransferase